MSMILDEKPIAMKSSSHFFQFDLLHLSGLSALSNNNNKKKENTVLVFGS